MKIRRPNLDRMRRAVVRPPKVTPAPRRISDKATFLEVTW